MSDVRVQDHETHELNARRNSIAANSLSLSPPFLFLRKALKSSRVIGLRVRPVRTASTFSRFRVGLGMLSTFFPARASALLVGRSQVGTWNLETLRWSRGSCASRQILLPPVEDADCGGRVGKEVVKKAFQRAGPEQTSHEHPDAWADILRARRFNEE